MALESELLVHAVADAFHASGAYAHCLRYVDGAVVDLDEQGYFLFAAVEYRVFFFQSL